ncbi:hypothetical protein [Sporosarcina sp. ZBG7A]|uniref:hypothetical protein n=1 Tax=Sporosarcina sp. ZBG7A TaxID=1582223 RepID=UPI00068AB7E2|nr:hypothetical protein [Sporosarcina sp. ZBG7A]
MRLLLDGIILSVLVLTSCTSESGTITEPTSKPPDSDEVLRQEPDADILQWQGSVYQADVEWIQELELTKNELLGEILYNSQIPEDFQDGTATKLPIGSVIYSTNEGGMYVLVEVDGELRKYLLLTEG